MEAERDIRNDLTGLVAKLQKDAMDDAEERANNFGKCNGAHELRHRRTYRHRY